MKKVFLLCSLTFLALPVLAVDGRHVKYVGGTLAGVNIGSVGRIETTEATALTLEYSGNKVRIPYASIESSEQSTEVARHLGVLPAIVVGLLKARQRRHFVRISYGDPSGNQVTQVLILEVPKTMARTLKAVLEARSSRHSEVRDRPCPATKY